MNVFSRIYHRIFDDLPKALRITCLVTMILFAFFGICLSLRAAISVNIGVGDVIGYIFIFLMCGVICSLAAAGIWHLLVKGTKASLPVKLQALFEQQGFSRELSETAKTANPFASGREQLQLAFIMVMSERYKDAEQMLLKFDVTNLSGRETAAYYTTRMQIFAMTSQHDKLLKLFNEHRAEIDRAYELKPDLNESYLSYADDALAYDMLAAVLTAHRGRDKQADEYEKRAAFQVSKRSDPEIQFFPFVFQLNRLYATGKMREAHDAENNLRGAILNSIMPGGILRALTQLIDQARIYSTLPEDKSEILAERNLPQQSTAVPAPAAASGIPDLQELS